MHTVGPCADPCRAPVWIRVNEAKHHKENQSVVISMIVHHISTERNGEPTTRPVMSQYFLAGTREGGAVMLVSVTKARMRGQ
jgi:hypothetical protein